MLSACFPALQVAVLTGLAGLPWVVKPLYGFISDSIPLFGYRYVRGSVWHMSGKNMYHSSESQ
jgi:hypothetical protein